MSSILYSSRPLLTRNLRWTGASSYARAFSSGARLYQRRTKTKPRTISKWDANLKREALLRSARFEEDELEELEELVRRVHDAQSPEDCERLQTDLAALHASYKIAAAHRVLTTDGRLDNSTPSKRQDMSPTEADHLRRLLDEYLRLRLRSLSPTLYASFNGEVTMRDRLGRVASTTGTLLYWLLTRSLLAVLRWIDERIEQARNHTG